MLPMTDELKIELDQNYFDGLSDGVMMVKTILELDMSSRKELFGDYDVSNILDKFDFRQIHEKLKARQPEKELKKFYMIRAIKVADNGFKKCIDESEYFITKPDDKQIEGFLRISDAATFAAVEEIYILD